VAEYIKYFPSSIDSISDNNDLFYALGVGGLTDATPNGK